MDYDKNTYNVYRGIVLSGWIVTLVTVSVILSCSVYYFLAFPDKPLPPALHEWAGISFGFLFGSFVALIKDFVETKKPPT